MEVTPSMFGRGILWRCFATWTISPVGSWPNGGYNKDKGVKLISGVGLLQSVQLQEVRSQAGMRAAVVTGRTSSSGWIRETRNVALAPTVCCTPWI